MHARQFPLLTATVLAGLGFMGAMGPPILAPLRESIQAEAGISRAALGLGFMTTNLLGCLLGLILSRFLPAWTRVAWFRLGLALVALGLGVFLLPFEGHAWVWALAAGWFVITCGMAMTGTANGMVSDLWDASPHMGVILLHAVNAGGKVLAPLAVLLVGVSVGRSLAGFAAAFLVLAGLCWAWPRDGVRFLTDHERSRPPSLSGRGRLWLWVCGLQFVFIAGAEAGVTSILGSLIEVRRVPPGSLGAPVWSAVTVLIMLSGILAGRIVFTLLAARWSERRIIAWCLAAGLAGTVPAAFGTRAVVYLPGLILLGVSFSATWPAWFGLLARTWPAERTFLSFVSSVGNALGVSLMVGVSSLVGNRPDRLPWALAASAAVMLPFALFALATRRRLGPVRSGPGPRLSERPAADATGPA